MSVEKPQIGTIQCYGTPFAVGKLIPLAQILYMSDTLQRLEAQMVKHPKMKLSLESMMSDVSDTSMGDLMDALGQTLRSHRTMIYTVISYKEYVSREPIQGTNTDRELRELQKN